MPKKGQFFKTYILPTHIKYNMELNNIEKTIKDIKTLKIQGARAVAIAGIGILQEIHKVSGFSDDFEYMCDRLEKTRPTAVPMHNAIEMIKTKRNESVFEDLLYFLENSKEKIAAHTQTTINEGATYITHCHSSEVIAAFKMAKREGKNFRVLVTETRPMLQGKITAKELMDAGIPVTYIVDSAASSFMKQTNAVMIGIDSIREEGVYNKIGSYAIALAAKKAGAPVYFLGNTLKIDRRETIMIEERPSKEVIDLRTLKGADIKNPAFDMTPWSLIEAVITERGKY